jgi:hypothetical protein
MTIATNGNPMPTLTETGSLPSGISFSDNHNGTATISGTLVAKKTGTFIVTVAAHSSQGTSYQTMTLTVAKPTEPKVLGVKSLRLAVGDHVADTISTSGFPTATLSESGTPPPGMAYTYVGGGAAKLTGVPTTPGSYSITITAQNSAGSNSKLLKIKVVA